jgi:hypothetical protein
MKNYLFLSFLLSIGSVVQAQETLPQSLNRVSVQGVGNKPLFIVKLEEKSFETRYTEGTTTQNILSEIDPNWIEYIEIFKDLEATEKFGEKGKEGVVIVVLKEESLKKMNEQFLKRFE